MPPILRHAVFVLALAGAFAPFVRSTEEARGGFAVPLTPAAGTPAGLSAEHELVHTSYPTAMVHAPSAVETRDGLLAAWYGGSGEAEPDVGIYLSRRGQGADAWSPPQRVADRATSMAANGGFVWSVGNPVLAVTPAGETLLFYVATSGGWSTAWIELLRSWDDGRTWSPPRRLVAAPWLNWSTLVKAPPVALRDGGLALPVYHELFRHRPELLILDTDGAVIDKAPISRRQTALQPAVVPFGQREALALLRPSRPPPYRVRAARTADGGANWRDLPPTPLANPGAAVAVLGLGDGTTLIAYNDDPRRRRGLSLALSRDGGESWTRPLGLAPVPDGQGAVERVSYPWLLAARDGRVHLFYTHDRRAIGHITMTPAWIRARLAE